MIYLYIPDISLCNYDGKNFNRIYNPYMLVKNDNILDIFT